MTAVGRGGGRGGGRDRERVAVYLGQKPTNQPTNPSLFQSHTHRHGGILTADLVLGSVQSQISSQIYREDKTGEPGLMVDISLTDRSHFFSARPPRWPSGEGVRLGSGRSGVRIPLAKGFFPGRVIPVTSKLALQWLPCQAPGVIGSALELVGPVSV